MIIKRLGANKLTVTRVEQSYKREIAPPTRASASIGVGKRRGRERESKSHTHLPTEASCWCVGYSLRVLTTACAEGYMWDLNTDLQVMQH